MNVERRSYSFVGGRPPPFNGGDVKPPTLQETVYEKEVLTLLRNRRGNDEPAKHIVAARDEPQTPGVEELRHGCRRRHAEDVDVEAAAWKHERQRVVIERSS